MTSASGFWTSSQAAAPSALSPSMHGTDVVTVDISHKAAACTLRNVIVNGVDGRADVRVGTLREYVSATKTFDLVVANPPLPPGRPWGDLSAALFDPGLRATIDLVAVLAGTMNATLDRPADAAERQRRFVADAAPELRSPLAGLRNTIEVALTHGNAADLPTLRATTERLQGLTDDLLLLARLERTAPSTGTPVDIAAIAEELVGERRHRVPPDKRSSWWPGSPHW